MKKMTICAAIAAIGLGAAASAEQVRFSELPPSVQKSINRNLSGGIVQEVDRKTDGGRTIYEVEIRREGKNRHIQVDADGKLLRRGPAQNIRDGDANLDIDVDTDNNRDILNKNDGKILGVIDDPDADFDAEGRLDDDGVRVEADVDRPADRGVTEDVFDKNDGKILDVIPAPSRDNAGASASVEVDRGSDLDIDGNVDLDDNNLRVDGEIDKPADRGVTEDLFDKNDGRILDVVPAPSRDNAGASAEVEVDTGRDLDADVDADLEADVDLDNDAKVEVENKGRGKGLFRKGDGKILGIPFPWLDKDEPKVRADVSTGNRNEITTDADGGLDTDNNDGRILGVPTRGFETLSLNDVPPVVRETIQREAGGYRIAEIERATLGERGVYEVDIEREGANRELHIAADGTILQDSDREAFGAPARNEAGQSRGK